MTAATTSRPRRADQGSALLIVIFFAAVMIISAAAATTSVLTQGRREKEEDLIWRGNQYARAVKLFYRKNGRFPQSMDDLTKKQNNIRYLRRAYEDPMNTEDGTWRLIYVGPGGQLIGSTSRMGGLIGMPQARPGATGTPAGAPTGAGVPAIPAAPATGTQPGGTTGTLGSGPIMGGNIIGVGSKVPKGSIKVYNGSQIYREWEFIWDPARDAMQSGQPGVGGPQPGTPAGQPPPPPRRP